ncbi:MAG: glutamate racemase [Phycisphaerae bacterium]|nr:glutamate racemase [Phycisphaerae bacterium]
MDSKPIAVFDSGLGGLTVVRALRRHLPHESLIYFGDTARVPYGIKSSETVVAFAEQDCNFLLRFNPKLVIAACNTVSALALEELTPKVPVPLVGVVGPGASEAVRQAGGRSIAVLATEATVASQAYIRAIHHLAPRTPVTQQRCPSLVSLIEEGRTSSDKILLMILDEYLDGVRQLDPAVVLLGCTHYPLVAEAVGKLMPLARIVDSADATARVVRELLANRDALSASVEPGRLRCYVSDNPQRFREVGGSFLGEPIREVTWITPEQFFHEQSVFKPVRELEDAIARGSDRPEAVHISSGR